MFHAQLDITSCNLYILLQYTIDSRICNLSHCTCQLINVPSHEERYMRELRCDVTVVFQGQILGPAQVRTHVDLDQVQLFLFTIFFIIVVFILSIFLYRVCHEEVKAC